MIYFLPNPFEDSYRFDFDHRDARGLFDRAIADGVIRKFILVVVDMNTPLGSSWYVNSPTTGNWEDFMVQELVPYIDANFKTIPNRDSRGIAGIFIGGGGLDSPTTATTVSVRDGKRQVHDGPYAETKEFLGGFAIIDVPNLDVALEWAARHPAAGHGQIEVRPMGGWFFAGNIRKTD